MRITCPGCAAEYEVPASRLPPHKIVRCVRCNGEWMPVREIIEAVPEPATDEEILPRVAPPVPAIAATDRLAPPERSPASHFWLMLAWVMTFIFMGSVVAATIVWRADIVRAWPPSALILSPNSLIKAAPEQKMGKNAE